jgi:NAD-dependent deacetylase
MDKLVRLLRESSYAVAFTGAGVSTLAGISDFRGKNGIYRRTDIDAEKIFSLDYFMHNPDYYYTHTKDFIYNLEDREPGIVHRELARLEKKSVVKSIITQNIDLLHQKAGSINVIEIHGSPSEHYCIRCGMIYSYRQIAGKVRKGEVPYCEKCGSAIKPKIIFFGETLDEDVLNMAFNEASKADLMLVMGSTLVVQPAASIPAATLAKGGKLVIINDMPTPLDYRAELRYPDLNTVFEYLAANF